MSWVTNLLLHRSKGDSDDGKIDEVNRYFTANADEVNEIIAGNYPAFPLVSVEDPSLPTGWYGGSKFLEATLLLGALNHLNLLDFYDHLHSIEWKYPEEVQLIVKQQEDFAFRLINVFPEAFAQAEKELMSGWGTNEIPERHSSMKLEKETRVSLSR